ncbi:MAG TPA: hypothetical protein PK408_00325 [Treponemataceae bacterium]|nr:hypothetical protein [Treponemataceae bacterium]
MKKWSHDESNNLAVARDEGLAEGALKKQREIAVNLKAAGFSAAQIAELTGLPVEAITGL